MPKLGRPSVFTETVANKMIELAGKGRTDKQTAEIIGVSPVTVDRWKKKHQAFRWSLNEAKAAADEMVEASLFMRALGYSHEEEKIFCYEGDIVKTKTVRHYPPDSTAAIFWLKNRQPKEWRENVQKPENDDLRNMSDEELLQKAETAIKEQKKLKLVK